MNFEEALRNELNGISDLTGKVFPLTAIEGVKTPYLVYISSEGLQEKYLDGYRGSKEVHCELHTLSDSYSGLKDIVGQVTTLVESFEKRVIGGSDGPYIQGLSIEKPSESYIPELYQFLSVLSITVRF